MMEPYLISWNVTQRCNLRCPHCYIDATQAAAPGELDTAEALRVIDDIAALAPGAMLIFSGGEPLLRPDLLLLLRQAADRGLMALVGSNGTLLTETLVVEMGKVGVRGMGISLDADEPGFHDTFRGVDGAWAKATQAMELCHRLGLPFQVQASVSQGNLNRIVAIASLSHQLGATVFNLFFLVCTGRGESLSDLTPQQYEQALTTLAQLQGQYPDMKVRARCAPYYVRIVAEQGLAPGEWPAGCLAGSRYLRLTPEGKVTPCPYLPLVVGDLRQQGLREIWETSPVLLALRSAQWGGKCGTCALAAQCRGCRARAYALTGDYLAEDPYCLSLPRAQLTGPAANAEVPWSQEARQRMERAPAFIRERVAQGVEAFARQRGYQEITPEVLAEARAKLLSGKHPHLPWHRPAK